MMGRAGFVAGNWKMHGSLVRNQELLDAVVSGTRSLQNVSCVVCVPYPYIAQTQSVLEGSHVLWGGQNVSQYHHGAYTGEVSADMLADLGCRYVIVGHSERRTLFGEGNQVVAEKFRAAQEHSITPILCVGETLAQRESDETEQVIAMQLDAVIDLAGIEALGQSVIAYEPVWAIGTGKTATPEIAQSVHAHIRAYLAGFSADVAAKVQILYGGSVTGATAAELFGQADIDGGLVGGASLKPEDFAQIIAGAKQ